MPEKSKLMHRQTISILQYALLAMCGLMTFLILIWLLKYCAYGFEFTDEAYYLVSISSPFLYDFTVTQFGFVYHILYKWIDGDIALLRQGNVLATFLLSWGMTCVLLKKLVLKNTQSTVSLHVLASGFAVSSLISFDWLITTPSYNSLAFQALLITGTGLILATENTNPKSLFGWTLIGFGGWLAFMAKPSTALALALGSLIYLLATRKLSFHMLMLAIIVSSTMLLASALLIDGSIFDFFQRILTGMEFGGRLRA